MIVLLHTAAKVDEEENYPEENYQEENYQTAAKVDATSLLVRRRIIRTQQLSES